MKEENFILLLAILAVIAGFMVVLSFAFFSSPINDGYDMDGNICKRIFSDFCVGEDQFLAYYKEANWCRVMYAAKECKKIGSESLSPRIPDIFSPYYACRDPKTNKTPNLVFVYPSNVTRACKEQFLYILEGAGGRR